MELRNTILEGDVRESLKQVPDKFVQTVVTSPPYYGLRDYGHDGQIGLESTPDAYVQNLVEVFREVRRVLRDDGTVWLNLGDSYASNPASGGPGKQWEANNQRTPLDRKYKRPPGLKPKDLIGIPWRVAFALQQDGWYLRQDIIWHKPNPMPESVTDRCTKAHEYLFLLSKSARYFYDAEAVKEVAIDPGVRISTAYGNAGTGRPSTTEYKREETGTRNRRSVWTIATQPYSGAHFATFPPKLIEPCILAGSRKGDIVLDPFFGSGVTGIVAKAHGRDYLGCELSSDYIEIANDRISNTIYNPQKDKYITGKKVSNSLF